MINWIKNYIDKKVDQKVQEALKNGKDFKKHARQATRGVMEDLVKTIIRGRPEKVDNIWSSTNHRDKAATEIVNQFRGLVKTALKNELKSLDKRQTRVHDYEKEMKEKVKRLIHSDRFIKEFVAVINEYQVNG